MLILAAFVSSIFSITLNGFVLVQLWTWFVSDFFGIRTITIPEGLGLALVLGYLTHQYQKDDREFVERVIYSIVYAISALAFGFIYHMFM
jgi:hypothetical protein